MLAGRGCNIAGALAQLVGELADITRTHCFALAFIIACCRSLRGGHDAYIELDYQHQSGLWVRWDLTHVGSLFADNLSAIEVDSYEASSLYAGFDYAIDRFTALPTIGVTNLFDEDCSQEIRIHAFGGRFYGAAPGRRVCGDVRMRCDFGD